ncbi:MAG: hypothetical protein QXX23_06350 [Thermoplasmata archaeon]
MSQPVSQPPNAGDKFEEIDEGVLVIQQNIRYLARLKGFTAKDVMYTLDDIEGDLINNKAIPKDIREVAETAVNIIENVYDETVKVSEEILKNPDNMKSVVFNAIEIYANFYAINTIIEELLEKYVYRYEQHGILNYVDEKLEKIKNIVTFLIDAKIKPYLATPYELSRLLGDIIDNILMFYELAEPDSKESDYMGIALSELRKQLEDKENGLDRGKYAILSDALDIIYNEYGSAVMEGDNQRYKVDELSIGTIDVCSDLEDPGRYGLFCDEEHEDAYKADSVDYKKLVKGMTEAYASLKAAQLVYKILQAYGIEDKDFEDNLADITEKTRDIIKTVINYIVRDYAFKINV